jgi:hypothetical protein
MLLFQEGNTVSNNKLIFPVALKTIIIKYNKYNFKQYIHIHNKISQIVVLNSTFRWLKYSTNNKPFLNVVPVIENVELE